MLEWFALHVRSNYEQQVQAGLRAIGIQNYTPFTKRKSRFVKGGTAEVPILPGYVFCRIDLEGQRIPALRITGAVRFIGYGTEPASIPDSEIESLRIITSSERAEVEAIIQRGDFVRIASGPLAGCEGFVERTKGVGRVTVRVPLLNRQVGAQVPLHWLRKAKPVMQTRKAA